MNISYTTLIVDKLKTSERLRMGMIEIKKIDVKEQ